MNGLLTYQCEHLTVKNNLANYCSGWGYHLYETCESVFENNSADFCCRYQPRGDHKGHMGADSAGFLIVFRSCNNIFHHNNARMSGDGFFLAGMTPQFEPVGCNNNIFEENDGSYSPNIAFEATFSKHNIYINNCANNSNYGFWLGFSSNAILENNQITGNRQAGIATENGINFIVRNNKFINNQHGILLWSKHIPDFDNGVSENITSCQWLIEENTFTVNHKAIRIAANQDHGIHPLPESGEFGLPAPQPYGHIIRKNHFEDNDHNIELFQTIDTLFETENNPNELSNYSDER
jgi:parallel beta-helix repeat protein